MAELTWDGKPDGTCYWCGVKLRERWEGSGPGYYGDNLFCTLRCAYLYGRWIIGSETIPPYRPVRLGRGASKGDRS